jgi:LmbE family N-acetylglucosaminyl deacetylase
MTKRIIVILIFLLVNNCCLLLKAQNTLRGPRVLVVIAHPDDESTFSVTLYKIIKEQHGVVDLFVITNGEAGYKYATLAENYYGLELTNQQIGRNNLPRIRKQELKNAGRILGVSNYYFQDQKDAHFGLNEREPLDTSWNVAAVKKHLNEALVNNHYDFVFCLLPDPGTHGQHKAATLLALNVVSGLLPNKRPIILGAATRNKADPMVTFSAYLNYKETQTLSDTPLFSVDRTASFSFKNRINYKIIANWEIAEHKSQGVTQMSVNDGDLEEFWYFKLNDSTGLKKADDLFDLLKQTPYLSKTY